MEWLLLALSLITLALVCVVRRDVRQIAATPAARAADAGTASAPADETIRADVRAAVMRAYVKTGGGRDLLRARLAARQGKA